MANKPERRSKHRRQSDAESATIEDIRQCRLEVDEQIKRLNNEFNPLRTMLTAVQDRIDAFNERMDANERMLSHVASGLEGLCVHTKTIEETAKRLAELKPVLDTYQAISAFGRANISIGRTIISLSKVMTALGIVLVAGAILFAGFERMYELTKVYLNGLIR